MNFLLWNDVDTSKYERVRNMRWERGLEFRKVKALIRTLVMYQGYAACTTSGQDRQGKVRYL